MKSRVSSMQKLDVIATEEIATVEKTVVTEEIVIVHPRARFFLDHHVLVQKVDTAAFR